MSLPNKLANLAAFEQRVNAVKYHTLHDEAYLVSAAMKKYGGSFMTSIGNALMHADSKNAEKIMVAWPDEWMTYLAYGREMQRSGEL